MVQNLLHLLLLFYLEGMVQEFFDHLLGFLFQQVSEVLIVVALLEDLVSELTDLSHDDLALVVGMISSLKLSFVGDVARLEFVLSSELGTGVVDHRGLEVVLLVRYDPGDLDGISFQLFDALCIQYLRLDLVCNSLLNPSFLECSRPKPLRCMDLESAPTLLCNVHIELQ